MILFDLGGVLFDFAGFEELGTILDEPVDRSEIQARWLGSSSVRDFELGRIGAAEFATRFLTEWALPLAPNEFLRAFDDWLRGFYPGTEALLRELGSNHRLACLSNTNEIHWERARGTLSPHLESVFLSFELGLVKPDPAIFRAAVAGLGVEAGEVLFFDDSESNVTSAAEVGLQAEQVRGPAELKERLVRLDLLPA